MKVGIVGVGFMGSTHAAGWGETEAQIAGFVAETTGRGAATGRAVRGASLSGPGGPAAMRWMSWILCTPTHLHHEMVLQAAAAGKHIICEKPLARTVEQAQEMIASLPQSRGATAGRPRGALLPRICPGQSRGRRAGRSASPGVLRLSRGSYRPKKPAGNWFLDEAKSGGILMDLMIHDFDYARWIAGEVESVFAKKVTTQHRRRQRRLRPGDLETHQRRAQPHRRGLGLPAAHLPHAPRDRRRRRADRVRLGRYRPDPQPDRQAGRRCRPTSACPPARSAKAPTPPRSKNSTGRCGRRARPRHRRRRPGGGADRRGRHPIGRHRAGRPTWRRCTEVLRMKIGILSFAHHHAEAYIHNLRAIPGVELMRRGRRRRRPRPALRRMRSPPAFSHPTRRCWRPNQMG